jgi:hypothetical protein
MSVAVLYQGRGDGVSAGVVWPVGLRDVQIAGVLDGRDDGGAD